MFALGFENEPGIVVGHRSSSLDKEDRDTPSQGPTDMDA